MNRLMAPLNTKAIAANLAQTGILAGIVGGFVASVRAMDGLME